MNHDKFFSFSFTICLLNENDKQKKLSKCCIDVCHSVFYLWVIRICVYMYVNMCCTLPSQFTHQPWAVSCGRSTQRKNTAVKSSLQSTTQPFHYLQSIHNYPPGWGNILFMLNNFFFNSSGWPVARQQRIECYRKWVSEPFRWRHLEGR